MIRDKRLEEIAARVEEATPGPWEAPRGFIDLTGNGEHWPMVCGRHSTIPGFDRFDLLYGMPEETLPGSRANMTFIAHAREDVPYLLKEVNRLRFALWSIAMGLPAPHEYAARKFGRTVEQLRRETTTDNTEDNKQ